MELYIDETLETMYALPFFLFAVLTEDDRKDLPNDFWCDVHRLVSRFHVSVCNANFTDSRDISVPRIFSFYGVGMVKQSINLTCKTER